MILNSGSTARRLWDRPSASMAASRLSGLPFSFLSVHQSIECKPRIEFNRLALLPVSALLPLVISAARREIKGDSQLTDEIYKLQTASHDGTARLRRLRRGCGTVGASDTGSPFRACSATSPISLCWSCSRKTIRSATRCSRICRTAI